MRTALEADAKAPKERDALQTKALELAEHVRIYDKLSQFELLRVLPPEKEGEEWQPLQGGDRKGIMLWATMLQAYARNDPRQFNTALAEYQSWLEKQPGAAKAGKAALESYFNHFAPFFWCQWLYVLSLTLCFLSWLFWREPLGRSAFWLAVFVLVVHTWALLTRMYLQERPPVTNLYSSAVFIGWGCVLLGLVLNAVFRQSLGIGVVVAGVLGFLTMFLAQYLGGSGDTMDVLEAVLDTNFWLATHVTCVTFGYVATLVAALLGAIYIIVGVLTPALSSPETQRDWTRMIYGTVCFATLLSFVGTVLGGIWADQSWGRFWGWDPKENGALLIVIMNALILHARWAGMVKHRGMAMLAVAGAMVTIWSWFGTNQLGVGLHAYGFNKALVIMCNVVWVVCLLLLGVGAIPLRYWQSFRVPAKPASAPAKPARAPSGAMPAASS
jgi:ABC-type transport system involved in cytochrome c biogenesis permease subunit